MSPKYKMKKTKITSIHVVGHERNGPMILTQTGQALYLREGFPRSLSQITDGVEER